MKTFKPVKAAVIGCGMISDIYLKNCVQVFNILDVVGCSDIVPERAAKRAEQYGIRHMTNEEILADPEIEIVLNLTYPTAHYEVSKAALLAGKHVHSEKMMAITLDQARDLVRIAREKGLYLTAAPDTFLGARLQTARRILDSGLIGTPISADMTLARGYRHADWKQEDEKRFAFCPGGSILNDVGCYYLTALVSMLGEIQAVTGFYDTYEPVRIFRHPKNPSYGKEMVYEAPNNFAGGLRFACGTLCSVMMTSETAGGGSHFAIYGTLGTIQLDDPNEFGGPLVVNLRGGSGPLPIPLTHAFTANTRGLGAADLAYAIRNGRPPRCGTELAFHTYEAAAGLIISCDTQRTYVMTSRCERPAPFEPGYTEYPELVMDL